MDQPRDRSSLWTIKELGRKVAEALSRDYQGPANGQVRAVPDRRTIRYYTTLGLLDRPARMRGRTALYGRRHLLQIVAIKRLQARGLALAAIQQELGGLTDRRLAEIARMPGNDGGRRGQKFWGVVPEPDQRGRSKKTKKSPCQSRGAAGTAEVEPARRSQLPEQLDLQAAVVTALSLAPGATLLLEAELDQQQLRRLAAAAAPLVELLPSLGRKAPITKE